MRAFERAGATVIPTGALSSNSAFWARAKKLSWKALGFEYETFRDPRVVDDLGRQIDRLATRVQADAVFSPGTHVVAGVRRLPFIAWPDATFSCWHDMIKPVKPFCKSAFLNGVALDRLALKNAAAIAYSSAWARNSALNDMGGSQHRTAVIPYGANLDKPPGKLDTHALPISRSSSLAEQCNLLFIGKDFIRKGGPKAVAIAGALEQRGIQVRLSIVGCPAEMIARALNGSIPDFVVCEGYLDAQVEADRIKLNPLYMQAHFLVLPTTADFTPMVIAESLAWGLPCLVTNVGGISSQMSSSCGRLFNMDDSADFWAGTVCEFTNDADRYVEFSRQARTHYEKHLNWDTSAGLFLNFAEERLAAGAANR
jgi:glycosyltransferase involved in cell wall biosynthesis